MSHEYDFGAADRLHKELTQLVAQLDWFIGLRVSNRENLLGSPHSDNWQGAKRKHYEGEYGRQQAALTDLKAAARTLQASVHRATDAARAAKKDSD